MYKDLFDQNNRMYVISTEKDVVKKRGVRQTGEFDKYILCQRCDNDRLGKLDRYASLILYEGYPKIIEHRVRLDGMKYTYLAELDYTKFKLFLLSVLWRASVSIRPLFQEVRLGPHENIIRRMLLDGNPGDQLTYPCLIMTYLTLKNIPGDIVPPPSRSKVDGGFVYKFLIAGMIYVFFVSKHIIPIGLQDVAISPKGELKIIHSPPEVAKMALSNMLGIKLI